MFFVEQDLLILDLMLLMNWEAQSAWQQKGQQPTILGACDHSMFYQKSCLLVIARCLYLLIFKTFECAFYRPDSSDLASMNVSMLIYLHLVDVLLSVTSWCLEVSNYLICCEILNCELLCLLQSLQSFTFSSNFSLYMNLIQFQFCKILSQRRKWKPFCQLSVWTWLNYRTQS